MKVAIRADAGRHMGTGHVMRCLTLAGRLRERGATVRFLCREHPGHLCELIESRGFAVARLPAGTTPYERADAGEPGHAHWLGTDWASDARQCAAALRDTGPWDWLVVDHYALDARWERELRSRADRILILDDLADRPHDCDLLLDQNLYDHQQTRYQGLVPAACRLLLGPGHALLREEFGRARAHLRPRDGRVERLLLFFGGIDEANMTGLALDALEDLRRTDLRVEVVLGAAAPHRQDIAARCAGHAQVRLHVQADNMAALMADADLALGAGGSTNWERLSLGLPSLLVAVAHNQERVLETMARRGLCRYLGTWRTITREGLAAAIQAQLADEAGNRAMSRAALSTMDHTFQNTLIDLMAPAPSVEVR